VVEVPIEEMFRSDRNRSKDYERAVVVEAEVKRNTKTTLRSARRAALKKDLTGPTLLEMSGLRGGFNRSIQRLFDINLLRTTC